MTPVTAALWAAAMLMGLQGSSSFPDSSVDFSSKNLSSVPRDLPRKAESIDLSCNHIQLLHGGDFKNTPLLRFLNVSWNSLKDIDEETFLDTPLLKDLDLSHNGLRNLSGQQYLLHTENLLVLNLAFNKFLTMTLGSEFSSLVKLETLALGPQNISMGDFKNIAKVKLRTLTLSLENKPWSYTAGSLIDVQAQRLQIALTGSRILDHDLVADALSLFAEVELMNLRSGMKDLSEQLIERVETLTSHLYLTNIYISWKDFTDSVNILLHTSITHLRISDVTMYNMPFEETNVTQTSKMKSFTAREAVVKGFFFSQEAVYNFFINMPVESLAMVEMPIIHMTCPKSHSPIRQLDFSNCALSNSIFSRVEGEEILECEKLDNVRKLNLVGNNLRSLQMLSKRVQYMKSLQHLDLSLNSLVYDGLLECFWPPNITNMTLSSNGLTGSVFKCLPKATENLDLQNNQVSVIPSSILKLGNLSSLNLNSNRLRDLPVCTGFPLLSELLLKSNSLHAPSVNKLESCPELKTLDVGHNPFTCTCALRSFISLGIKSKRRSHTGIQLLSWPKGYYCTYPEAVRGFSLKDISIPEVSCNVGLLAAAILGPAVIVMIAIVTLCHHLDVPWYMGMIWQWTRAKHRARMRQVRPEDLLGVEFHAFVSYSQHDADWVQNSLLPNLEGPAGGLQICHHEKSFVPGKTIIENIIACLEKSRRSVFVLSANFVKSEWCHYELYFASHQRLAWGPDSVVLVLLEPLPQYLIPSKYNQLKSMMGRHTYLEWPQERAKHRLFWANLRAALQADLPNAPVTHEEE